LRRAGIRLTALLTRPGHILRSLPIREGVLLALVQALRQRAGILRLALLLFPCLIPEGLGILCRLCLRRPLALKIRLFLLALAHPVLIGALLGGPLLLGCPALAGMGAVARGGRVLLPLLLGGKRLLQLLDRRL